MSVKTSAFRTASIVAAACAASLVLSAMPAHADSIQATYSSVTSTGSLGNNAAPGGKVSRKQAISRAQVWVDKQVPYSANGLVAPYSWWSDASTGGRYRQDCSGFVSMAWQLNSSNTTYSLPEVSTQINKWDLQPGDALNSNDHVVLFAGWRDKSAGTFNYYQESSRSRPTNYNTDGNLYASTLASHPTSSYSALRYDNIVDDPTAPSTYSGDLPVSGRWSNGSATTVGVFRDGTWALRDANGGTTAVGFGQAGDVPMTGDFDGVGHDQLGIFRPSTSTFVVRHDDGSITSLVFGQAGDIPVPGMWDGNGHAQMGVYRPSTGTFIVRHDDGSVTTAALGQAGDIPIVGDWDGVGHTQMGVFRPGTNAGDQNTFVLRHDDGSLSIAAYGVKGDLPVVGDWSNKGRTTYGIYRTGNGTFALSNAYAGTADAVFTYGNGGTWS